MDGRTSFDFIAREMPLHKNDEDRIPRIDGGNTEKDFAEARAPRTSNMHCKVVDNLKNKRRTTKSKESVRPSTRPPRNITAAIMRSDCKEWAKAHDAELDRHDTELRIWLYEEALPSDKLVP